MSMLSFCSRRDLIFSLAGLWLETKDSHISVSLSWFISGLQAFDGACATFCSFDFLLIC